LPLEPVLRLALAPELVREAAEGEDLGASAAQERHSLGGAAPSRARIRLCRSADDRGSGWAKIERTVVETEHLALPGRSVSDAARMRPEALLACSLAAIPSTSPR
jgi:hypothetical protein